MTKTERDEIVRLCSLTQATWSDKESCQKMIQKYISPGFTFCMTCDQQVVNAFMRLRTWWSETDQTKTKKIY